MKSESEADTPATRFLTERGVSYVEHRYDYLERGGARHAAESLGVDDHLVVKTLVMRTETGRPVLVLMHGDCRVSTKSLARAAGERRMTACSSNEAFQATGYVVGGISPFGTRKRLPVYVEATILDVPRIFINGGRRGLLLEITSSVLREVLDLREVSIAEGGR